MVDELHFEQSGDTLRLRRENNRCLGVGPPIFPLILCNHYGLLFHYHRVPRLTLILACVGVPVALILAGPLSALGFALGAAASLWNYNHLVTSVTTLTAAAASQSDPGAARLLAGFLLRLAVLGGGAIVILRYSRINPIALFVGLFTAFIAIALELTYELLWKNAKSG